MLEMILNDKEIAAIINNVNNIIVINNCGCHGMGHVTRVMNYVEILLNGIGADEHTIELGKVSAYLHDIGAVMGKNGHAERSAEFVDKYLTRLGINEEDKNIIVSAIREHSNGSKTYIGATLTFADKIDMQMARMLRFKKDNYFHDNIKHMLNVELATDEENIIVNIVTDGLFDYNSLKDYPKMITKPVEMTKYLQRNCIFAIDGQAIDLYSIIIDDKNVLMKIKN